VADYVPERGDFIALTFDPPSGHEQKGHRPGIVISKTPFNERTGLAIVCPLTTTDRGYPFHVEVVGDPRVSGYVMVEQVKSIDYRARKAKQLGRASEELMDAVLALLDACVY
jgi:mRNA interferase MazF